YVEVRCMDVDPFCAIGISSATVRFLDMFLLHCLLSDSAPDTREEIATIARNQHRVAQHGRDPSIRLTRYAEEIGLAEWGTELLSECEPIAAALDRAHGGNAYGDVLAAALATLRDPSETPSAKVLRRVEEVFDKSFLRFALAQSWQQRQELLERPFTPDTEARYRRAAEDSIAAARRIEAADRVPFEVYRQRYLSWPSASPTRR
ncbi:MAG: glutamate--cysteine ligase, partial [Burkholderiales bacterium]